MNGSRGSSRSADESGQTLWYYTDERWLYLRAGASGLAEAVLFGIDCPVPEEDDTASAELIVRLPSGQALRVPRWSGDLLRLVSPAGVEPVEVPQTPAQLAAFVGDIVDGRLPIDDELHGVADADSLRQLLDRHATRGL